MAATEYYGVVQQIYVAYFGRPADPVGLANFATQLDAVGAPKTLAGVEQAYATNSTIKALVDQFGTSSESATLYAGASTAAFVNAIYTNVLNRTADTEGLLYWASAIDRGVLSRGKAALSIMAGAVANTSAQGVIDAAVVTNKITVATNFTTALDTTAEILSYAGDAAAASARAMLLTVNNTTNTTTFPVDATISSIGSAGTVGTTFTLTTGVDQGTAFTGGAGNDTFVAAYNVTGTANTLGSLDALDGGAGTDTLAITQDTGAFTLPAATLSNIENITIRGVAAVTADTTGATVSGLTSLASTQSTTAGLTAAATTDISVSGASGAVTVNGGKNVSVTHAAAGADITIGATTVNAGTVSVTSTKMGAQSIAVDGGTSVTIVATGSSGGGDTITVGNGGATTDLPSGAVSVTSNHTGVAATDVTLNAITVKGGSTVTVVQTADTSKAATDTTGATLTQGAVTVVGGGATTSVTVSQAASTTEVLSVAASASVTETASVKFSALTAGQTLVLGGLTFTASTAMTAAEAAGAFANLVNGTLPAAGDSQSGGAASKGTYTGIFTGWTSGAVSTDTVVFTSTTAGVNVADLVNAGTGTATVTTTSGSAAGAAEVQTLDFTGITSTAGNITVGGVSVAVLGTDTSQQIADKVVAALNAVAAGSAIGDATATDGGGTTPVVTITYPASWGNVAQATAVSGTGTLSGAVTAATTTAGGAASAKTGVLGVIDGVVTIDDNATTASITTVTVDGYGNGSTIGNTTSLTKLATLSLANSGGATAGATNGSMTVDAAGVATLGLTLNKIKGAVSLDGAADSALKTLNVTTTGADSSFALTAASVETLTVAGTKTATFTADLAAVKSVTVTGSAGLVLSGNEGNTLTSVDTSGTTGAVSATIEGARATYTGGAGVDTVTLATDTALTKAINLGAGDDTLSFAALNVTGSTAAVNGGDGTDTLSMAIATAANLDNAAQSFYTNFEHLTLNDAGAGGETIDLANLGFTNYVTTTGSGGTLTLNNMASNGTIVITTAPTTGYTVGVKDAATGTTDVLNVVLSSSGNLGAGVLTAANVETINISTVDTQAAPQTKNVDTLTLTADKATSVSVTGAADLTLTMTGSTKVATIDGSAMTGGLTVTSLNTTSATTITGGSGNDVLTAATGTTADVLVGGAGEDTLTANAGLDTLTGGAGNDLFVIGTASLNSSSYATITDFTAGDLIKFTGADSFAAAKITQADTAVFQDYANAAINAVGANDISWFQYNGNTYIVMDAGADTTTFTNGQDFIVKLTGLVDLTNASFNSTYQTIAL